MSKGAGPAFVAERSAPGPARPSPAATARTTVELLDWAGFGVAVANAHADILERADLVVPSVDEEGIAAPDRSLLPRLHPMIDARAARQAPDEFRRRLARKSAGEAFDAWLAADERWRALVPVVDELRGQTKLKGKPTPEQLAELQG